MITVKQKGDWSKTTKYLKNAEQLRIRSILDKYGSAGVRALARATPVNTGLTANSWDYKIETNSKGYTIEWFNSNVNRGSVIALLIQYGHGTGTGGYVPPNDYINPTLKPIFDKLADDVWKEVSNL